MQHPVYTIGHSTHSSSFFRNLLLLHSVTAVCDVRSRPYSRTNPQFNRETLRSELKKEGVAYVFLGSELGARPSDSGCYEDGRAKYRLIGATDAFKRGIERVIEGSKTHAVALMCAEKDPLQCHRTILVGQALYEAGMPVRHILPDGSVEMHEAACERLIVNLKMSDVDIFRTKAEILADALRSQAELIEFREASAGEFSSADPNYRRTLQRNRIHR